VVAIITEAVYYFNRQNTKEGKEMKAKELEVVLENHKKWLIGDGGSRADLSGAYLSRAEPTGYAEKEAQ
jgi:hypothetical protein